MSNQVFDRRKNKRNYEEKRDKTDKLWGFEGEINYGSKRVSILDYSVY